jgi:hypothetical protein
MQVNRRYWLQLMRTFDTIRGQRKFLVMLDPQVSGYYNSIVTSTLNGDSVLQSYCLDLQM